MKKILDEVLSNPYKNYIYAYPHKKAYRKFDEEINLEKLWNNSSKKEITLYIHIPFCTNKCGYCNLLSSTCNDKIKIRKYVQVLIKEIKSVKEFLNLNDKTSVFSSVIFGGGTPTILEDEDLIEILEELKRSLNINFEKVFFSMESSPRTLNSQKIEILKKYNVDRISMGIQSFKDEELKAIYRFENVASIEKALEKLFVEDIKIKNLDLIYGLPTQTLETWEYSLKNILKHNPEEIFIYPMYIREKTKLYSKYNRDFEKMIKMYEFARQLLQESNYIQTSMRNFIRRDMKTKLYPSYSCQENEMIGIGCGARSYISNVHYSRKYAVEQKNINEIIDEYLQEDNFEYARYGYILNEDEQKRRYILKSILKVTGLDLNEYTEKFNGSIIENFKIKSEKENVSIISFLMENEFLEKKDNRLMITDKGLMYSDRIGDLFISDEVKMKTEKFKM